MAIPGLPQQVNPMSALLNGVPESIIKNLMERRRGEQAERHFQEQLKLQKAAQARAGANSDLQRKMMELQLNKLEMETDPMKKMAYVNSILEGVRGMHGGQKPQEEKMMGMFTGQGMPSTEEIEHPTVKAPSMEEIQKGFGNFSPEEQMALGIAGIKLPTVHETPAERRAAEYDQRIKLAQAKAELEGKTTNTNAIKTLNQNIVNGVPKVQRQIEEIIKAGSPSMANIFRSGAKAKHNALVNEAADTLIKAKGWPNTNLSLKNAKEILDRGTLETDSAYRERLKNLSKSLNADYNQSKNVLGKGTNASSESNVSESDPLGLGL